MGLYRAAGGDNNEIYARGWRGDTMGTREECGGGSSDQGKSPRARCSALANNRLLRPQLIEMAKPLQSPAKYVNDIR
jgi:hypothetical protein